MILSKGYLSGLLDRALAQIVVPDGCGAVLEGSLAEGFGNESSDIDFLLITDDDRIHLTMPSILFIDGRRVEVRTKSVRQVREQAAAVMAPGRAGGRRLARIPEDLLNRCQRLARAIPLRRGPLIEAARSALPRAEVDAIVSAWFGHFARQSARQAVVLEVLRQLDDAANWSRVALIQAAKSWVAARGESYLEPKWLPQQFARIPDSTQLSARTWSLESPVVAHPRYLGACADLVADLGVRDCARDPGRVFIARRRGVTTWGDFDCVHVVRNRQDVFALGPAASKVWRSMVFAWPLAHVIAGTGIDRGTAGALIAEFQRLGLIRLCWRGGGTITPAQPFSPTDPITPPPSAHRPILGPGGALFGPEDDEVKLVPLPAQRFGAAAMALVWANIMVENAREDVVGALKSEQWQVAALTARRMLQHACRGILSAYGAVPLPPDGDVVRRVDRVAGLPATIKAWARELDEGLRVGSAAEGHAALAGLDDFVRQVRDVTGANLFPASFDSLDHWRRTLGISYDWVRLGAYLNADFPLDEGRDLVQSVGNQPHISPVGGEQADGR